MAFEPRSASETHAAVPMFRRRRDTLDAAPAGRGVVPIGCAGEGPGLAAAFAIDPA